MIYFVLSGDFVKIGHSVNPEKRLTVLSTGCPTECKMIGVMPGNQPDEAKVHKQFSHLRTKGEWFRFSPEIKRFVSKNTVAPVIKPKRGMVASMPIVFPMENEIDVKAIRDTLGLTQAGLAEQVGVDQSTISNWEKGQAPRGPARKLLLSLITPKPKRRPIREAVE